MYDARNPAASAISAAAATAGSVVLVTHANVESSSPSNSRSANESTTLAVRSWGRSETPAATRNAPAASAVHPAGSGSRSRIRHAETPIAIVAAPHSTGTTARSFASSRILTSTIAGEPSNPPTTARTARKGRGRMRPARRPSARKETHEDLRREGHPQRPAGGARWLGQDDPARGDALH